MSEVEMDQRPDCCLIETSRSGRTVDFYRRTYRQLLNRCAVDSCDDDATRLSVAIRWCQTNSSWKPATCRIYKAALRQAASDLEQALGPECVSIAGLMSKIDLIGRDGNKNGEFIEKRTSARKRKTVKMIDWKKILVALQNKKTDTTKVLMGLVAYGPVFGLRPAEWCSAVVSGGRLLVKNAKSSNGRACGAFRWLDLSGFDKNFVSHLAEFIKLFRHQVQKSACWDQFYNRIAKALTRVCREVGVKPICLYTLRHQFAATAKALFPLNLVAALMGHASDRTASRHYARRHSGWRGVVLPKASPENIALVRNVARQFSCSGRSNLRLNTYT